MDRKYLHHILKRVFHFEPISTFLMFSIKFHSTLSRDLDEISVMASFNSELIDPSETPAIRGGHVGSKSDNLRAVSWFFSSLSRKLSQNSQ
jgi:hypothetical protein